MRQDFGDYFKGQIHEARVKSATDIEYNRLAEIGRRDLFAALSEAMGTLFGIAHFFRSLGLKHIATRFWTESREYLEKK